MTQMSVHDLRFLLTRQRESQGFDKEIIAFCVRGLFKHYHHKVRGYKLHKLFIQLQRCLDEQKKPVNIRGESVLALTAAIRLFGAVCGAFRLSQISFISNSSPNKLFCLLHFPFQAME